MERQSLAIEWLECFQLAQLDTIKVPPPSPHDYPPGNSVGSKYDDPHIIAVLNTIVEDLEQGIPPDSRIERPILGTSPLFTPNAQHFYHRKSGLDIIVVQRGIFHLFSKAASALTHGFPVRGKYSSAAINDLILDQSPIDQDIVLVLLLEAVLTAALQDGIKARAIACQTFGFDVFDPRVAPRSSENAARLFDFMLGFLIAHEYGHALDRKWGREAIRFGQLGPLNEKATIKMIARVTDEFWADDIAVNIALRRSSRGGGAELSYLGVVLFFDLMMFFERCVFTLRDGHHEISDRLDNLTHPPLLTRKQHIQDAISHINGSPTDTKRGAVIAVSFEMILAWAWSNFEPLFAEWHSNGKWRELAPEFLRRKDPFKEKYTFRFSRPYEGGDISE